MSRSTRPGHNQMTYSILGTGNVGVALAADIEHRGDRALLYATPGHDRVLKKIEAQGYIDATEALHGRYYPAITHDLGHLISSSDNLVITLPSDAHEELLALLRPYKDWLHNKTVIFITGNGVSPLAYRELELSNAFETSRAPYTCRIEEHDQNVVKIRVNGFKMRTVIAGVHKPTSAIRDSINRLFGMPVAWYDNIMQVLLVNNHGLLHPSTMLRNQENIRQGRSMFFYRECMTPAVCQEMEKADHELFAIGRALGVEQKESLAQTLNGDYGTHYTDLRTSVDRIQALNKRHSLPRSMKFRYITQDIQVLVVLWSSLGHALGVETPVLDSWIREASQVNGADYRRSGRTLKRFGLEPNASRSEIRAAFCIPDSLTASDRRNVHAVPVQLPEKLRSAMHSMPAIRIR